MYFLDSIAYITMYIIIAFNNFNFFMRWVWFKYKSNILQKAVLGGGWYECPNGHTYHVDQCGKPMEKLNCPTCGAVIGGIDHELDPSNKKKATQQDQTLPGI